MQSFISSEVLDNYLNGTCTEQEREEVERWYDSFENAPDLDSEIPDLRNEKYSRHILDKIKSKIKQHDTHTPNWKAMVFRQWHWALAASVFIAFGISFLWRGYVIAEKPEKNIIAQQKAHHVENTTDQITLELLPDSSKVWLNPGSKISYSIKYGEKIREISLDGEAFFDVVRNTAKPFIIHTGKMTTQVLGTSFNVQARKDSKHFEVSVVSGSLEVSGPEGKTVIKARQQVAFDRASGKLNEFSRVPSAPLKIWEPVTINFEWASVQQVTSTLQETFAIQFEFENETIQNCFLRADFTNLRLPVILDLLCQSVGATYTINNGIIRLSGKGCE